MAYNTSKGTRDLGDIHNEDDTDTQIDFESNSIALKTNNTERLVVNNSGCGIGTSSPEALLHIQSGSAGTIAAAGGTLLVLESSEKPKIHFQSANAYGGSLIFGSVADNDEGQIDYDNGSDRFLFKTGGSTKMAILGNNVGIGVSDPDQILEVGGAVHVSGEVSSPSAPSDGDGGILYVKSDGKPYWISNEVSETDLTSGGGGISWDGSTANGIATYKDSDEATVESNLTFDGTTLTVTGDTTIDKNHTGGGDATVTGLQIDLDKTTATTSNNTMYGINIDMDNTTATNGTNYMYGLNVTPTLTHAADAGASFVYGALINAQGGTNGSSFVQGARIEAGGGDVNYGLQLDVEDGGVDLRIESSADNGDYFQIQTTTHGATTITTVDDDATAADLTFNVDGDISMVPTAGSVKVTGAVSGSGTVQTGGGLVTRGTLQVTGSGVVSGSFRAKQIFVTRHYYENGSQDSFKFINFMNASETNVGSATYTNSMVAPFDGKLVRVLAKIENSQNGNVVVSIHTGSGLTISNEPEIERVTVSMPDSANAVGVFNTTGSQHFTAGSLIGIGVKPNTGADPGRVSMQCIWEYDVFGL